MLVPWGRATAATPGAAAGTDDALRHLEPDHLGEVDRKAAASMIDRDLRRRSDEVNARSRAEWSAIRDRTEWEAYRDERLARLQTSLGEFPPAPDRLNVHVAGTVTGDGYRIVNLAYESRPGQWVAGNLYEPAAPSKSMPALLIAHAHHRPKDQGEMQDMGMTWARAGCVVLVIDQVGYGERRAHPFNTAADYPREYPVSRQDYYFRYDSGIQLQLAGDSLMGWMVWDLRRAVDLLLGRPGVDPQRVILLGAVAGGGDPCGVTAALDRRIAAAVPFNFGGPQPEARYPLPDDAETSFNYLGGSYWESTRGLRRGGVDGFLHWVIVGGIAPRRLIHAHEFSWDQQRDPVWKRYERIFGTFYGVPENLAFAHGKGLLRQSSQEASHCTNIGAYHRKMIHPVFQRWFGIEVSPETEYSQRREPRELVCLTDAARSELKPRSFVELVTDLGAQRAALAQQRLAAMPPDEHKAQLRAEWARLLGNVTPAAPQVKSVQATQPPEATFGVERVVLEVEPEFVVPLLVLLPKQRSPRSPVVVGLAQTGKAGFLEHRSSELNELLTRGAIVCLPDLRGTGETKAATGRDRGSDDGNRSVNMLLHGETLVGQRLRDLRGVLAWLRGRNDVDRRRISLWGDSFAPRNDAGVNCTVPHGIDGRPLQSEPLGGLMALFGALFDDEIESVYVRGGLVSYQSVLTSPCVLIPHDAVVPGAQRAGDLSQVAAALAPRPLQLGNLVDGSNRLAPADTVRSTYEAAVQAYRTAGAADALSLTADSPSPAKWLLRLK